MNELFDKAKLLLPQVPESDLKTFVEICHFKTFENKEIVLAAGQSKKLAFLIVKGVVRGYVIDKNGEDKTTLLRSTGIFVGDTEVLFKNNRQRLTFECVGSTELLLFDFEQFESLAYRYPSINRLYIESLKEAIIRLSYRVDSMITLNHEERYLDLLKKNPAFLKDTYDKYVAHFLGITPVSLSRIKKRILLKN